jgi:hypothetical protein
MAQHEERGYVGTVCLEGFLIAGDNRYLKSRTRTVRL